MTKDAFDALIPLAIPRSVAVCPICEAPLVLEELSEWYEPTKDRIAVDEHTGSLSFNCTTEPDIDSEEWEEWMRGHWSTPYMDWLPLERKVKRWLQEFLARENSPLHTNARLIRNDHC